MAKRPTSQSQADDIAGGAPTPARARRPRATKRDKPVPPGAPVPSDTQSARAEAKDEQPITLDPGARPEGLDAVTLESPAEQWRPSEQDIRVRAYHRYLERGASHGMAFDDWLEAEKDLTERRR